VCISILCTSIYNPCICVSYVSIHIYVFPMHTHICVSYVKTYRVHMYSVYIYQNIQMNVHTKKLDIVWQPIQDNVPRVIFKCAYISCMYMLLMYTYYAQAQALDIVRICIYIHIFRYIYIFIYMCTNAHICPINVCTMYMYPISIYVLSMFVVCICILYT